jgi:hypothetical protein
MILYSGKCEKALLYWCECDECMIGILGFENRITDEINSMGSCRREMEGCSTPSNGPVRHENGYLPINATDYIALFC